jgi:hypothetical protein
MKTWHRGLRLLAVLALLLTFAVQFRPTTAQGSFADPAFQRTWERTDKPVADGKANRSWYWGPTPGFATTEPYKNAPGGNRLVQYFDKTRMEINNPAGDKSSPFYVTNGLLAQELMTGRMQVGDNDYEQRCAADIPLASDNDDATGPTYATFGKLMSAAKVNQVGQKALAMTDRAGNVSADASKATVAGVDLVYYDAITQRNVPKVFWDFLNAQGPVYVNGAYSTAQINQPWFFASGLPTTEAYWAKAKIGGQQLDVLVQGFERRVLTYIPAYNGTPFNVQMGNVGQHYYDWRYKSAGCSGGPGPAPTQPPAATPVPTTVAADCSGIPDPKSATIKPTNCGPIGTVYEIHITGFTPGEKISYWLTLPDGLVFGTEQPFDAGNHPGALDDEFDSSDLDLLGDDALGIWAITYQGEQSAHQSIVWFKVLPATPPAPGPTTQPGTTPTPAPPVACDLNGTKDANVNPTSAKVGADIQVEVFGFQPNERASYWLTDPDGAVFGSQQIINMDGQGRFNGRLSTEGMYPGRWALTAHGLNSNHESVGVYCLNP